MPYKELYRTCRNEFYVSSDSILRKQLVEYYDHSLLKSHRGADGLEYLQIPLTTLALKKFLETAKWSALSHVFFTNLTGKPCCFVFVQLHCLKWPFLYNTPQKFHSNFFFFLRSTSFQIVKKNHGWECGETVPSGKKTLSKLWFYVLEPRLIDWLIDWMDLRFVSLSGGSHCLSYLFPYCDPMILLFSVQQKNSESRNVENSNYPASEIAEWCPK